jgi:hypothetical protein
MPDSDTTAPALAVPPTAGAPQYPNAWFPLLFADNAPNAVWGRGVVKFYLARTEPRMDQVGEAKDQAIAQIVMPIEGFVAATQFFARVIDAMIADGNIKAERVEEIRRAGEQHFVRPTTT